MVFTRFTKVLGIALLFALSSLGAVNRSFVSVCCSVKVDTSSLFIDGKQDPELMSDQFAFTEGPSADRQGNVYFTDQPNNKIWKYNVNGRLSVFMNNAGRSNGTYFDRKGNLVTCADAENELWQISPKGRVKVLLHNLHGKRLNGPNDLWINKRGNIYFTDPYYQRDYWTRKQSEPDGQNVYLLRNGSKVPEVVAADLIKPNGIVGSADGRRLFVADIQAGKIYTYAIAPTGQLTGKQEFYNQGADGITLDERGNLYLAGNGITVVNPQGVKIAHINVPQPWAANLCFGGRHRNLLFITASKGVYILPMKVKGIE